MDLINKVTHLNIDKRYFRIRTDYGLNYDTFVENSFVAIGYNYVGKNRLNAEDQSSVRQLIRSNENLSEENSSHKKKISRIFNMLQDFKNLKKGDVVVIPSQDSDLISFGEINDEEIYQNLEGVYDCEYTKRRAVRWFKTINWKGLDPKLIPLKSRGDAINEFTHLSEDIDKVMRNLFVKDDFAHFVIDINDEDPIKLIDLINLLQGIRDLSDLIIKKYKLTENIDDILIKLNVQSPGKTEMIKIGKALLIVAAMISVSSCERGESGLSMQDETEVLQLNDEFPTEIDAIMNTFDNLDVPNNNRHYYKQ